MNIDPFAETYTDIRSIQMFAKDGKLTQVYEVSGGEKVTAIARSKEALQKLQDDLRKAGYRKQR